MGPLVVVGLFFDILVGIDAISHSKPGINDVKLFALGIEASDGKEVSSSCRPSVADDYRISLFLGY